MSTKSEMVSVFAATSLGTLSVAKSILDDAGIQYMVKGEHLQNLIGPGVMGLGYNTIIGPVEILVNVSDESTVKELLKDVN